MNCDYIYAKLQGINGIEYNIKSFPLLLIRKQNLAEQKQLGLDLSQIETLQITKCTSDPQFIAVVSYDYEKEQYFLINGCKMTVNNDQYDTSPLFQESIQYLIKDNCAAKHKLYQVYNENLIHLTTLSKIHIECDKCEICHVYFFVLPKKQTNKNEDFSIKLSGNSYLPLNLQKNFINPRNKIPDLELSQKWTPDEKESLKRCILTYGYGRWKKIQKEKFSEKERKEIIVFANAFIRCLIDNLTQDSSELQNFLLGIIEEQAEDSYIAPSNKDWDIIGQAPRAIPWGRRIQLLYRIRVLIKKFKKGQQEEDLNWGTLLNFIPDQILMGQRPSVWWSRQHDIDLLRGIYRYGYANYAEIRDYHEFSFYQMEQNNIDQNGVFHEFPSSDNATRRLKKLMGAIMKVENEKGRLNFEMEQSQDMQLDGWKPEELQRFFIFLIDFGIPVHQDGKSNWIELKDKFGQHMNRMGIDFNKNHIQIEKLVCYIRTKCNQIMHNFNNKKNEETPKKQQEDSNKDQEQNEESKTQQNNNPSNVKESNQKMETENKMQDIQEEDSKKQQLVDITASQAFAFTKNTNHLYVIRKNLSESFFKQSLESLEKKSEENFKSGVYCQAEYGYQQDWNILRALNEHGMNCHSYLQQLDSYFNNLDKETIEQRMHFLLEFYKQYVFQQNQKQKKIMSKGNQEDNPKKKLKVEIKRDEEGKIIYPIQINNSLKLVNLGTISTNPNYHSEHNLFPIGFKSIRVYASIFHKNQKCEYLNEILEGPENKPIYRVTCSEDAQNPIVKDSSTGCWVYICSKVNQLQDHKKEKVTISGTERFGLLETNINRLLEELPNAELCYKYQFKYKNYPQINQS